ncbi:tRNA (guanine-N1)-methyltransferase [Marinilabilia rubra]|uniref:tRNA (Guanine-N1)-methyltransferase n=1 Tax=Marinilabilia rubra TaxID=2162893 RepID=A0A2U2BDL0_9BACT|nr:tRNA (guanine-N1)-methyltransferase [Marinilabilia rubra]PWE01150.1 tRNA (guanine-N1)-methyltransferase [Marinilabilia rubra]
MKITKSIYFLIAIVLITNSASAQNDETEATLDQGPISGQFDYMIEESSRYEEFRVVKIAWLNKLKSNVLDSLGNLQSTIESRNSSIDSLNNRIGEINQTLDNTKEDLNEAVTAKNSIPFLGSEMPKGKYNSLMWGVVIILAAAAGFLFLLFKRSHHVTSEMKEKYNILEKEYEGHRKRALEKEKTMARQHLNELNKLRGRD